MRITRTNFFEWVFDVLMGAFPVFFLSVAVEVWRPGVVSSSLNLLATLVVLLVGLVACIYYVRPQKISFLFLMLNVLAIVVAVFVLAQHVALVWRIIGCFVLFGLLVIFAKSSYDGES